MIRRKGPGEAVPTGSPAGGGPESGAQTATGVRVGPATGRPSGRPGGTADGVTERLSVGARTPPWSLDAGTVLADRFRLVRPLGRGGMGEVFEALDLELGERVALKTIRPDLTAESLSLQRFRREVQMARRVTHRNVCRIFDVFRHTPSPGDGADEVVFLTMELLEGETLDRRIARQGVLPVDDALEIGRQLASALDAAHRAGVVHRDFKSANVMLVDDGDGGDRVVVTDFGLARPQAGANLTAALTVDGKALGTPDYMAPEQVEGGEVTAAADLYAFGITLYEMVTGRRPFTGDSPLTTAVKRLREPPPPPSAHRPDLSSSWEAAILRCLARRPEERFDSAGDVVRAIEGVRPRAPSRSRRAADRGTHRPRERDAPSPGGRRWKIAALLLVILASAAVTYYRFLEWKSAGETVRQVVDLPSGDTVLRSSVAVLRLEDLTGGGDTAWLATAFAEMLRAELRTGDSLRVLEGHTVARLAPELARGGGTGGAGGTGGSPARDGHGLDRETLQSLRRTLGSDYVVTGSYVTLGEPEARRIRLDLRVYDARSGEVITSVTETADEADLFDLVASAGKTLRGALGVAADGAAPRTALPASPRAAKLYAEGLAALQGFDPAAAKDLFEQASRAEPTNPLIHSALSLAWSDLGFRERAREEARRAMDLSENLPREEHLSIEARFLETTGRWTEAARTYRDLWALYPDNLEYGLRLAECQTRAGRADQALIAVAALHTLPEPAGRDPRIDLAGARAASALGSFRRQREAAERAAERASRQGTELLLAQARLMSCEALRNLGRPARARAACEEALEIYARRGDRGGEAAALVGVAGVLYEQGDLPAARSRFEEALAVNRAMGNQGGVAAVLNNLAVVLRGQGDLSRARALYVEALEVTRQIGNRVGEAHALTNLSSLFIQQGGLGRARDLAGEALELFRSLGDRGGEATALDHLGVIDRLTGELEASRRGHRRALEIRREIGQRRGEAASLKNLARTAYDAGDLDAAREGYEEALRLSRESGHPDMAAAALHGLGLVLLESDRLQEARARQREALRVREEVGQPGAVAESRLALARLALESGRAEEAVDLGRRAAAEVASQGLEDDRALALATVAEGLRRLGRVDEARGVIDEARGVADTVESRGVRVSVAIEAARIDLASGEGGRARVTLDQALSRAESAGLVGLVLEVRLARTRVRRAAGATDGAAELLLLAQDARAAGFDRLARHAREAGGDPPTRPGIAPRRGGR
ncbi:MAG: tetratricopeptide repeat protein [Acidobacteriota bacterium]